MANYSNRPMVRPTPLDDVYRGNVLAQEFDNTIHIFVSCFGTGQHFELFLSLEAC